MRKIIVIIYLLACLTTKSQNLVTNSSFDNYSTYIDSNNNLVYQPINWYYDQKISNHPIYISSDRFLDKSLNYNYHPEAERVNKGEKLNYIALTILPNTQKVFTILNCSLVKDHTYVIQMDIKSLRQSNCMSDILIGLYDSISYNSIKSSNLIRIQLPDTMTLNYLNSNWITIQTPYKTLDNKKVLAIGDGNSNDYKDIINSNHPKFLDTYNGGPYQLKYFIDNVSIVDITNGLAPISLLDSLNVGNSITLNNIYFDFDKFLILNNSFPILDALANYLKTRSEIKIQVIGHTDNVGSQEYNHELSLNRANEVVKYLISKGVSKERLSALGYGSEKPIGSNYNKEGRKKNRRIEIKIVDK